MAIRSVFGTVQVCRAGAAAEVADAHPSVAHNTRVAVRRIASSADVLMAVYSKTKVRGPLSTLLGEVKIEAYSRTPIR